MSHDSGQRRHGFGLALASAVVTEIWATRFMGDLTALMEAVCREMGFRYYALIHHADLAEPHPELVDIKDYPAAIADRLFEQRRYRRDPIIRGCVFADSAFPVVRPADDHPVGCPGSRKLRIRRP
jgi:hypothetical protein